MNQEKAKKIFNSYLQKTDKRMMACLFYHNVKEYQLTQDNNLTKATLVYKRLKEYSYTYQLVIHFNPEQPYDLGHIFVLPQNVFEDFKAKFLEQFNSDLI